MEDAIQMAGRILVIDDEDPILFAMRVYFGSLGYQVDCARGLEAAWALLGNVEYAAVIADLRLTGLYGGEGLEIIAFVRERCPGSRIVLLTAYGSPLVEAEARRLGADAFLMKPLPLPQIAQVVFSLLGRNA